MSKAILEFNMPEERDEFLMAAHALEMSIALDEIRNYIRSKIKYHDISEEAEDMLEDIRSICYIPALEE